MLHIHSEYLIELSSADNFSVPERFYFFYVNFENKSADELKNDGFNKMMIILIFSVFLLKNKVINDIIYFITCIISFYSLH